jgi:hypothetical protein
LNAPRTTATGAPTNVYTVLLVETPASTSSKVHPAVPRMAAAISSITCGQWHHVSGKWQVALRLKCISESPATRWFWNCDTVNTLSNGAGRH